MPDFSFRPRSYVHFDMPLKRDAAERLATTPTAVARHPFYPFIYSVQVTQKIGRDEADKVYWKPEKKRVIAYAAHGDSHIFSHYAEILIEHYEAVLAEKGLQDCVTAFRKLNGQRNIHFANEVFNFIRDTSACSALAMDVTDFFGSLDHDVLKSAWASLLQQPKLPDDHFAVYKAITRYSQVKMETLYNVLHIPLKAPRAKGNHRLAHIDQQGNRTIPANTNRLCSPDRFRRIVREERGLCQTNTTGKGIPQGSPISAILSNIYMLGMDSALHSFASDNNGLYRRYCDDILIVLPTVELRDRARQMIETWLTQLRLQFNAAKTETVDFHEQRPISGKPLQYLGFTFDGRNKRIRPASVQRYFQKMRRGVLRAKIQREKADEKAERNEPSTLKKKRLYRLYSYLGKKLGKTREERRNFLSYAFDAARIMNDPGIKRQVKDHWNRLQEEIAKPLPPRAPPVHIRVQIRRARERREGLMRYFGIDT